MGARFGWERPNWYAKNGEEPSDTYSYRRSNWWEPVKREVMGMRERVGLLELSGFSKFESKAPARVASSTAGRQRDPAEKAQCAWPA